MKSQLGMAGSLMGLQSGDRHCTTNILHPQQNPVITHDHDWLKHLTDNFYEFNKKLVKVKL